MSSPYKDVGDIGIDIYSPRFEGCMDTRYACGINPAQRTNFCFRIVHEKKKIEIRFWVVTASLFLV